MSYSTPMTSTEEKMKPFFLHQKRFFFKQQVTLIFQNQQVTLHFHITYYTNDHTNPFFCKISFYKKRINWYTGIVISYKQQLECSILSLLVYQLNHYSIWQPAFRIVVFLTLIPTLQTLWTYNITSESFSFHGNYKHKNNHLTTRQSSWTSCCIKLSRVSHLKNNSKKVKMVDNFERRFTE